MEYRLPRKRTIAIVLGLTAIVFVSGSMVVSHFRKSPIGTVSLSEPVPELDRYVRNTSWETGYLSGVPYRKGDVLEFLYFANSKFPYAYEFDWDAFRTKFDIESVSDESGEISPESLEGTTFRKSSRLTIRAKAKTNGTTVSDVALRSELRKVSDEVLPEESSTGTLANTGSVTASGAVDASAFRLLESSFSADTNNALRILWAPNGSIASVVIGDKTFRGGDVSEGYAFVVERASFVTGEYFVAVHLKDGRLVPLAEKASFESDGQLVGVSAIVPSSVSNARDSYVTLQGRGFSKIVSVQLSNSLVIKNASFRAVDDTVAIVRIPANIPEWSYAMNIMDVSGISSPKRAVLRITK